MGYVNIIFPPSLGDYDDVVDIRWLPPGNQKEYWQECVTSLEAQSQKPVSYRRFNQIWDESFKQFRIRKGVRASTCRVCGEIYDKLSKERNPVERRNIEKTRREHLDLVRQERHRYYFRQQLARQHPELYLSIIIDGMDQASCYLPNLGDKVDLSASLNVKVIGAITHGHKPERHIHLLQVRWRH